MNSRAYSSPHGGGDGGGGGDGEADGGGDGDADGGSDGAADGGGDGAGDGSGDVRDAPASLAQMPCCATGAAQPSMPGRQPTYALQSLAGVGS